MRSEERAVMKSDLLLGGIMLGTGFLSGGVDAVQAVPVVTVTMSALVSAAVFIAEHDVVPGLYPEVATVAAFIVVVAVGAAFITVLPTPVAVVSAAALTSGGIGLVLYRVVFGVVLDVPVRRLEKQS